MLFRKRPVAIPDSDWSAVCRAFPLVTALDPAGAPRLRDLAARFLRAKSIEPARGLEMDDAARAGLAALACVPVLGLGLDAYRGWTSLVVHPGGFLARGHDVDEAGVVHEFEEPRSGEAWLQGPVVLSWEDVAASGQLDGYNVVIHEMAHKLDMLNGDANGFPPLGRDMDRKAWHGAFTAAFDHMNACLDQDLDPPLDEYAAESPGEFFAVASEYFFELPEVLRDAYPDVYRQLAAFYRVDPVAGQRGGA